jgi:proline iminopeptidase
MESFSQSPAAINTPRLLFGALIVILAALATVPVRAQPPDTPSRHPEAKSIIANARKIVTAHGVERLEKATIGGIDQWVSIRGTDVRNPVLLLIHGGPGYVSMPMSWWFSRGWEEYFTVVQWDQRGAGKTYLLNDPAVIGPTITRERMLADAEEMTTCQLTDGPESERRGWRFTMDAARRAGNAEAVDQLQAIAPYFPPGQKASLKDIYTERRWLDLFGGVMAHRDGNSAESDLADLSPDYSSGEIARIWEGNDFSERYLLAEILGLDLTDIRQLSCPLIIFAGRYDVNVNSDVAAAWFTKVNAPSKQFIWFENSAHLPMTEEPGKFLISLVRYARPIAEKARDVPPPAGR